MLGVAVLLGLLFSWPPPFRLTFAGRWAVRMLTAFLLVATASAFDSLFPEKSWWFMGRFWTIWLVVVLAARLLDAPPKIMTAVWMIVLAQGVNAAIVNRE
jgi:hypothetical protein